MSAVIKKNFFISLPKLDKGQDELKWSYFEVRDCPGKGKGLFCKKTPPKGGVGMMLASI